MNIFTDRKPTYIDRSQLMMSDKAYIPYRRVEYLQSTGSQYMWLGVMSDEVTDISCEFEVVSYPGSDWHAVYGAEQNMSGEWGGWRQMFLRYDPSGRLYVGVGHSSVYTEYLGVVGKDVKHVIEMHKNESDPHILYDGQKIAFPYSPTPFSKQMSLFTHDGSAQKMGKMKIMRFACKTSSGKRLDLYPVKVDGFGRMFDAVAGELMGNVGTFVCGPEI